MKRRVHIVLIGVLAALAVAGCASYGDLIDISDELDGIENTAMILRLGDGPAKNLVLYRRYEDEAGSAPRYLALVMMDEDHGGELDKSRLQFLADGEPFTLTAIEVGGEHREIAIFGINVPDIEALATAESVEVRFSGGEVSFEKNLIPREIRGITRFYEELVVPDVVTGRDWDEQQLQTLRDAVDATNPETRRFALEVAASHPGHFSIAQVCAIYSYIRENWRYVDDPRGNDYFAKASETIDAGLIGDCDDFAVLVAATIEAIGGEARVTLGFTEKGGHAYAEVFCGKGKRVKRQVRDEVNEHYRAWYQKLLGIRAVRTVACRGNATEGIWMNLDWWSEYPGGPYIKGESQRVVFYPIRGDYERIRTPTRQDVLARQAGKSGGP